MAWQQVQRRHRARRLKREVRGSAARAHAPPNSPSAAAFGCPLPGSDSLNRWCYSTGCRQQQLQIPSPSWPTPVAPGATGKLANSCRLPPPLEFASLLALPKLPLPLPLSALLPSLLPSFSLLLPPARRRPSPPARCCRLPLPPLPLPSLDCRPGGGWRGTLYPGSASASRITCCAIHSPKSTGR